MNAANFPRELGRCDGIAHAPAGGVHGLAERKAHDTSLVELLVADDTRVLLAVVHHVLVDLVRQDHRLRVTQDVSELIQIAARERHAGGIVRRVDHDQSQSRRDGFANPLPIDPEMRRLEWNVNRCAARENDGWCVRVVGRIEQNHFVPGMHQRADRRENGFRRAQRDGDFGFGIGRAPIASPEFQGDLLTQRGLAGHRRVLVVAGSGEFSEQPFEQVRRIEIRKSLREMDGAELARTLCHDREDRGADVGKFRSNFHNAYASGQA